MFGACDRTAKRLFEGAKQALGWTSAADVPQPDSRASLSEAARPFAKEFRQGGAGRAELRASARCRCPCVAQALTDR